MRRIIDSHLDLSWNALSYNRDQTESVQQIRAREEGMNDDPSRTRATVSLPELRKGGFCVVVGTLLAHAQRPVKAWKRVDLDYGTPDIAYAAAKGQLAYYQMLETRGQIQFIRTGAELKRCWQELPTDAKLPQGYPIGMILAMEGADPIVDPSQTQEWFDFGLRCVGLAHFGPATYARGNGGQGPVTQLGHKLLAAMQRLGMILDLTHTAEPGFYQALDAFGGRVMASHNNCRALVPGDRQFSDDQMQRLIKRDAVIGVVMDNWMLSPNYPQGRGDRNIVSLSHVADHIDHICQLAGDVRHVGIGTDLDGGYGFEQTPREIDTIADVQKLAPILAQRGYSDADIDLVFHGNWLRFFEESLPK